MSRGSAYMPRIWLCSLALLLGLALAAPAVAQDANSSEIMGSDLTAKQKDEFATATVDELEVSMQTVLELIETAAASNDVILLNCLNEKFGLLKGLHKVAEDARLGLAEAVSRENADLQEHNFRKAYIAREQGQAVTAEAEACIGQVGTSFPGQTRVVVRFDGSDSADSDFGGADGGDTRPPDSSPTE